MALIGKIRNNPILVLLFIGGGILLFVLSDIMNSGNSGPIGPAEAMMGRVGEIEIERNDFERTLAVSGNAGDAAQNRNNLWNFYLSEGLITDEAQKIGLAVSKEEMNQLNFGPRYSPVIRQNYADPATGQMNTQFLNDIRTRIEEGSIEEGIENRELNPNFVPIWKYQNRQVSANRLQEKLTALVSKAMYAPSWMAQDYANDQVSTRNVAYVKIPFDELANDEVEVTESDLQAYMDEYRSSFMNLEETRRLAYVSFDVTPTSADSTALREEMAERAANWSNKVTAQDDSLFTIGFDGVYAGNYLTATSISPVISDRVFGNMEVGTVYGPYVEGNQMKLAKLIDRQDMADSVSIRRIVRNANTPSQFEQANLLIDSLQNALQGSRGNFSELADEFNRDPRSSATSGEINNVTPGQMNRAVDRLLFINGNVGELYKVTTATNVQLIEIIRRSSTSTPRANVATIAENIIPSKDTEDAVRVEAEEFLSGKSNLSELKAAAESAGLTVETTPPLGIGTPFIPELGSGSDVRDMLCWAFAEDAGDLSGFVYTFTDPELFYENKYVVTGLESVLPKGVAPLEAVREDLETVVIDIVKGRKLAAAMAGKDLSALAAQYDVTVDTLTSVNPTMQSLPNGIGAEPKVLAAVTNTATGSASQPVVGNTGVFVVMPMSDAPAANSGNLPVARQSMNLNTRLRVGGQLLTAMRSTADVEDQRVSTECNR